MSRIPSKGQADRDDFYVGYLPLPVLQKTFLRWFLPTTLTLLVASAVLIAANQRDPGDAIWTTNETFSVEGRLVVDPYPRILAPDGVVLLVESGKIGAQTRTRDLDGQQVRATGFPLRRGDGLMLELIAGDSALESIGQDSPAPESEIVEETVTLVGEIVDSKCYHGAMKPGDGKTHKACAILCIKGGIPPILISQKNGTNEVIFLSGPDGQSLGDWLLPYVGEPVEVVGVLQTSSSVQTLIVAQSGVRLR